MNTTELALPRNRDTMDQMTNIRIMKNTKNGL